MITQSGVLGRLPLVFWFLAVAAIAIWSQCPGYVVGWDLNVYKLAVLSLRSGHDPYLACVAARKVYFDHLATHPWASQPFGYIYPPVTLPLLRILSKGSLSAIGVAYWAFYVISVAITIRVSTFSIQKDEWTAFVFIAPVVVFFPGLLLSDPLFSGNIAYILMGMIFAGAFVGWRSGRWVLFYMAVLGASMIKPTFLSLLAIPVMTARRQWLPATATGTLSVCCILLQITLWPRQFGTYRMSLHSQLLAYIHDFGFHPAGILANTLYARVPYRLTFGLVYVGCTLLVGGILLHLRLRFFRNEFSLFEWIPAVLIGVTLLNPRIMQYDLLPITLPMTLVGWRFFYRWLGNRQQAILAMVVLCVALNAIGAFAWEKTECLLLLALFLAGSWTLVKSDSLEKVTYMSNLALNKA